MVDGSYKAADIVRLTNGRISAKMLNHWSARNEWLVPPAAPGKGRARTFTRINVIEAVLAGEMMRVGMDRRTVRSMMHHRSLGQWIELEAAGLPHDVPGGAGANLQYLPEFEPGSQDWFWVCRFSPLTSLIVEAPRAIKGTGRLAGALAGDADPVSTVINVSSVVRRLDEDLP